MKVVIDTSSIISALIKKGISGEIIIHAYFEFFAPDFTLDEIKKHEDMICGKAGITEKDFDLLLELLFANIEILPFSEYERDIKEATRLLSGVDMDDVPFLACAMAIKADGIWSDDEHFQKQKRMKIFKTKEMIKFMH